MNILAIAWRLLRYRVAVMLLLFMLFGVALHGGLEHPLAWHLLLAGLALAASYISATSVNDLADYHIDAINHAKSPGRPLVTGKAQPRDMWRVFAVSSSVAVGAAAGAAWQAAIVMTVAICINVVYSLPPVRLSYRTFLAPLLLGLGYVCVPYLLGVTVTDRTVYADDIQWLAGLYLLFVGRIILKDFRDRKGDAAFGKPTFLLRYGKAATCVVSMLLITAGGLVIAWQARTIPWLPMFVAAYVAAILGMLVRLYRSPVGQAEQVSIGVGAKMGNGLFITLLTAYALHIAGVPEGSILTAASAVTALFLVNYVLFLRRPEQAAIGYRG